MHSLPFDGGPRFITSTFWIPWSHTTPKANGTPEEAMINLGEDEL